MPVRVARPGTAPRRVAEPPKWLRHKGAPAPCGARHQTTRPDRTLIVQGPLSVPHMNELFGTLSDGTPVHRWTLQRAGVRVRILSYGGIVQSVEIPDRDGRTGNVVL